MKKVLILLLTITLWSCFKKEPKQDATFNIVLEYNNGDVDSLIRPYYIGSNPKGAYTYLSSRGCLIIGYSNDITYWDTNAACGVRRIRSVYITYNQDKDTIK